ncbi:MAG: glycosyltransferase [Acidimicrobiales bacterium]
MIERLGIGDTVSILGPTTDPPAVLAAADAGILSSKNETGPLVVLEYMASALPWIASDTGEIVRAVRDADVGFVVPPRDHLALADALERLVTMPGDERRAMGERGRDLVRTTFDQPLVTRKIEQVYELVLGMRRRAQIDLPSPGDPDGLIAPRPAIR